jgi:hypothetical protein
MGLFVPALFNAIKTRLRFDSTLAALLGPGAAAGIRNQTMPPAVDPSGTTFPCVVFRFRNADSVDALRTRRYEIDFDVEMYVEENPAAGGDSLLTLCKIHERIIGNYVDNTNLPQYGLDRWVPDFTGQSGDASTTYSAEMVIHVRTFDDSDAEQGRLKWVSQYKTSLDKVVT